MDKKQFLKFLRESINYAKKRPWIFISLIVFISLSSYIFYLIAFGGRDGFGPNPLKITGLILLDCFLLLIVLVSVIDKIFRIREKKYENHTNSKLQKRMVWAFGLVTAIPTVTISVFSAYFFYFGIQTWFDKKISTVLDRSISVARAYMDEHRARVREAAISTAADLGEMYYDLAYDLGLFTKTLSAEAEMRLLDEAIVFQKNYDSVITGTPFTYAFTFFEIPSEAMEKVDSGDIVDIDSDPTKIRTIIKLRGYDDTYLMVGKSIDSRIIEQANMGISAAGEYYELKNRTLEMQVKFFFVFLSLSILLLIISIFWARITAKKIVGPITDLVSATEKVKEGNLEARLSEKGLKDDEIKTLFSAFNDMIKKLDKQRRDLSIAQRAAAWSDVARRIAHEIKNPLTPIKLSAERLYDKFAGEVSDVDSFKKYIEVISKHSGDIGRIVSEFVNFARMPLPVFSEVELVSLLSALTESRKLLNDSVKYEFSSSDREIKFLCDSSQITQAVLNLIKNSEESIEGGKKGSLIKISLQKKSEILIIEISDDGSGFDRYSASKAGEAYFTTKLKGTGLGLAIVKKIATDHFGEMEIVSSEGGGASVKLVFDISKKRENKSRVS